MARAREGGDWVELKTQMLPLVLSMAQIVPSLVLTVTSEALGLVPHRKASASMEPIWPWTGKVTSSAEIKAATIGSKAPS